MPDHRRSRRLSADRTPLNHAVRGRSGTPGLHRAVSGVARSSPRRLAAVVISLLIAFAITAVVIDGRTPQATAGSPDVAGFRAVSGFRAPAQAAPQPSSSSTHRLHHWRHHPRKHRKSATSSPTTGSTSGSATRSQAASPPAKSSAPTSSGSTKGATAPADCVSQAQGIPSSGAYLGAAVSGTASLPAVEQRAGREIAIHRNYFMPDQVDYAITSVKQDLAAGRLPWISFKVPYSWADMAAGRGDAWATDLADKLAKVGGPVWLAFHHEPEGDGNMKDWTRMQQHLAPIIHARTNNVAFTVIMIAWNEFFGPDASENINQTYPGSKYVDILGMDVYNEYGAKSFIKTSLDPMKYFKVISDFAQAHGVDWAVAETGYTKQAASVDPTWLQTAYKDLQDEGGLALTYFDSSYNSIADWTLDDSVRAGAFASLLSQSARICS